MFFVLDRDGDTVSTEVALYSEYVLENRRVSGGVGWPNPDVHSWPHSLSPLDNNIPLFSCSVVYCVFERIRDTLGELVEPWSTCVGTRRDVSWSAPFSRHRNGLASDDKGVDQFIWHAVSFRLFLSMDVSF